MSQASVRCIAFDLEGPLSPQDAAFELMGLIPGGHELFRAISRYDDLLALAGRPGYEPGDTLALIVPFLLYHDLSEEQLIALADRATLVAGARELIAELTSRGYQVFCITTTYEQYARRVAARAGIDSERVACTSFPLGSLRQRLGKADFALVAEVEAQLAALHIQRDEARLQALLDDFFWQKLPQAALGQAMAAVQPVGGNRKVRALDQFASRYQPDLSRWAVVGDSITDAAMLTAVANDGGLAIAFNGNEYALACANLGVASMSLGALSPLLLAWEEGGLERAKGLALSRPKGFAAAATKPPDEEGPHYHWLADRREREAALAAHRRFRAQVRQAAAALG